MVEHHIQKRIISDLVACESARYAQLKPSHIESNVFTYHLQSLIRQNLIAKHTDGSYSLTSDGKLYGINSSLKTKELLEQAHAIILISIRNGNSWLLRKRLVQPMFGKVGFMHGEPRAGETIQQAGARILKYRCGLQGQFEVKGSGFVYLQTDGMSVAYSNFTLLEATNVEGDLVETDAHGENIWHENPDFSADNMIPSMQDFSQAITAPGLFFLDKVYAI
jgi:hypothetical protein